MKKWRNAMEIDEERLNSFMGKMIGDVGAAMNASLMLIGDKLGLYKALARGGEMNPAALAQAIGTAERYVREWLSAQADSGYVETTPHRASSRCYQNRFWRSLTRIALSSWGRSGTSCRPLSLMSP
jgi:hypothetical protein